MSSIRGSSALVALILLVAPSARAQSENAAMAETLFKDAKDLMSKGDYAAACPKFAESNRLDPGTGTLTALALCHEAQGRTASAWAEFIEVQSAAQQAQRPDREALAKQHIAALEPQIPHLTIRVTEKVTDLKVFRDDAAINNAAWSSPLAVDPGEHIVRAEAPNYKPFSINVTLAASETKTVEIPALEKLPPTAGGTGGGVGTETPRDGGGQRIAGIVVGATGLVAIGVGSFFGVQAISNANSANMACPSSPCTDATGVQSNNTAKGDALAADVLIGVGAVALVVGVIVFLIAPKTSTTSTSTPVALRGTSLRFEF